MMVLISYDVSTTDASGRTRLRKVAKECQNHAQRVQNSVFEANLDYSAFMKLKARLVELIDPETDSLRFYYLGNNWKRRVEHVGAKETYDSEGGNHPVRKLPKRTGNDGKLVEGSPKIKYNYDRKRT